MDEWADGRAGGGTGGRTDGRTDGRLARQAGGRTGLRTGKRGGWTAGWTGWRRRQGVPQLRKDQIARPRWIKGYMPSPGTLWGACGLSIVFPYIGISRTISDYFRLLRRFLKISDYLRSSRTIPDYHGPLLFVPKQEDMFSSRTRIHVEFLERDACTLAG